MRPRIVSPFASAYACDVTTSAAAPSLSELALPAVTVASLALAERGTQLRERVGRRVGARTFVGVDDGVALLARDRDGRDLGLELAGALRVDRLAVRRGRELVLLLRA